MNAFSKRYEDASSSLAESPCGCKLFQRRDLAEPLPHGPRRNAAPAGARRNIAVDAAGGRDLSAHADPDMALHGHLAADGHVILDRRRAGDADLGHDHAMAADHDVMGDLHEVIDLGALADHRIAAGAPVDRGVRADLHIVLDDDAPDLRHLEVALRPHGEAEPVLADPDARMKDDPVAEIGVGDGHIGGDGAVPADPDVGTDDRMGADQRAGPISACGPTTAPGSTRTPCSSLADGWTKEPGEMPVAAKEDSGRIADGNRTARTWAKTR